MAVQRKGFAAPNDPILIKIAEEVPVKEITSPKTQEIIKKMLAFAYPEQSDKKKPVLVGLAAPQVKITKRIILVDVKAEGHGVVGDLSVFINPEIVWKSKEKEEWYEGCFSTDRVCGIVSRPKSVKVRAYTREGKKVEETYSGYVARIFQHEIDHLNGKEFVTHIADDNKLHWVEDGEFPQYRDKEAWRTWPNKCPREKWEEIKGIRVKKIVLITGGTDGLGKTIAEHLAPDYQVVILSPTEKNLKSVAKDIGVDYFLADVSNFKSLQKAINEVVKKYGRIDCLVNNAGLWIQDELDQNEVSQIEKVIAVNNLGVVLASKAVIPQMKKQKSGLIVNINSQGGFYAKAERAVYSAAKWGVTGFTKSLQSELAKYGIAVTGIYPGKMNTKMFEKMGIQKDMADALDTKEVARVVRFLLETNNNVVFPEIGIKNINN